MAPRRAFGRTVRHTDRFQIRGNPRLRREARLFHPDHRLSERRSRHPDRDHLRAGAFQFQEEYFIREIHFKGKPRGDGAGFDLRSGFRGFRELLA